MYIAFRSLINLDQMVSNEYINSNCQLRVKIIEGSWKKGADLIGKQDPYIKFVYDGREFKTATKHGAGKHAVFNEAFVLPDIQKQVQDDASLVLTSYDKDVTTSAWLGEIEPVPFQNLIRSHQEIEHRVDMFNKKKKKCGHLVFSTWYQWAQPDPLSEQQKYKRYDLNKSLNQIFNQICINKSN